MSVMGSNTTNVKVVGKEYLQRKVCILISLEIGDMSTCIQGNRLRKLY